MKHNFKIDYQLLLDSIEEPIFVHDKDFNIIYANQAYINLAQKDISDIYNNPYWESFPLRKDPLPACIKALTSRKVEVEVIHDDSGATYLSRSFPVDTINNEYKWSIHVFSNITVVEDLNYKIQKAKDEINETLLGSIRVVAAAIEQRDPYTADHQGRVAQLSKMIAQSMGLKKKQVAGVYFGALIHDIGKIRIPAEILTSPRKLLREEFELIKMHPIFGANIIGSIKYPWPIREIVIQHHEKLDGSGYPFGLKENDILIESKIVTVADVYEAMTSSRPYREKLEKHLAINELMNGAGTKYDKDVVALCVDLVAKENFNLGL